MLNMVKDSSVGTATRYGLDGPVIEFRWGARFYAHVQTGSGADPASYTMGTGSFLGLRWLGHGIDHPPPSSAKVEGRVELYICSSSGPLWPILGRTFSLPLPIPLPILIEYVHDTIPLSKLLYFNFIPPTSFCCCTFSVYISIPVL